MSCSTNASRSAGVERARARRAARARPSRPGAPRARGRCRPRGSTIGSGTRASSGSSRRDAARAQHVEATRARRPSSASRRGSRPRSCRTRLRRSHASWTASSASLSEPSIRYATDRRWTRCASNCRVRYSRSSTVASTLRRRRRGRLRRAVRGDGARAGAQEAAGGHGADGEDRRRPPERGGVASTAAWPQRGGAAPWSVRTPSPPTRPACSAARCRSSRRSAARC